MERTAFRAVVAAEPMKTTVMARENLPRGRGVIRAAARRIARRFERVARFAHDLLRDLL